jgi:hypothetical protein
MANQSPPSPLIGWPLLPLPDSEGCLNYPSLEESVRQSIRVILITRPGEQLMRPTFGAGLEVFLHDQNTLTTGSGDGIARALGEANQRRSS